MSMIRHRRHLARYREIATILTRHGLGWLVVQLGLTEAIPFQRGLLGHARRDEAYTRPEHFRMALEDLGATFIKLGQILSTRGDLLPPEYIAEFAKLQDAVPPVPYPEIARMLEAELGEPPEAIFAAFDHTPRAAASIGQAHAARLKDGANVIIKVQRPGVAAAVERDLDVLTDLARLAATRTALGEHANLQALAQEFADTIRAELDYVREGRNADRFRRNFADDAMLHVPHVYWEHTTTRVLTLEEIQGIKINDLAALDAAGIDRHTLAETSARIILREVFEHGFFHADPHPGNFFVQPGGVIGLIDYGMIGRLDEALKESLLRLTLAVIREDGDRIVDELLALGVAAGRVNRQALKRDMLRLIADYEGRPLGEWGASTALTTILAVAYRHRLQLPADLTLLAKVIAMSEGLGAQLDPNFNLIQFAAPYLRRIWLRSRAPDQMARKLVAGVVDIADLSLGLPQRTQRILSQAERGELTVMTRIERQDEALDRLNRIANRLALSILTSALIIGLGLVMLIYHPASWAAWAGWIFGVAFVAVVLLGLWLLWSIRRA